MLNITPELKQAGIIVAIVGIAIHTTLILLQLVFYIRERKTGKPNPLMKEWP